MKRRLLGHIGLAAIGAMAAVLVPLEPLAATPAITAPTLTNCPNGLDTPLDSAHFRVWACNDGPGAGVDEAAASGYVESLWSPMTTFMNTQPLADTDNDPLIDVFLIDAGQVLTREGVTTDLAANLGMAPRDDTAGTVSRGYILVSRALLQGVGFKSTVAHEIFHVLQFAYNDFASCSKYWFAEASAKWAEWYFVPETAAQMVYPFFTNFQKVNAVSLNDVVHGSPYGAFVWPLFMQQEVGAQSIQNAWSSMKTLQGCAALDGALDAQLPFAKNFGHFAVRNFDTQVPDLITRKLAWPSFFGPKYQDPGLLPLQGTAPPFPQLEPVSFQYSLTQGAAYPWTLSVPVNRPGLSTQYDEIDVSGSVSVELDFTKLSNPQNLDVHLIAGDLGGGPGGFVLIPVSGLDVKICLAADTAVFANIFVVLDNHALPGSSATVTGKYKAIARTTCADGLHGKLALTYITKDLAPTTTTIHQTLTLTATSSAAGWSWVPGSTYSATFLSTSPANCPGGTITTKGQNNGPMQPLDIINQSIYQAAYTIQPAIIGALLEQETAIGTSSSPCGSGVTSVSLGGGSECPHVGGGSFTGSYSSGDLSAVWKCSDNYTIGGLTTTNIITGTLTAFDPMPCGLWQPGPPTCPVGL